MVERAAGQADHLRADGDAAFVQSFDGDFIAFAEFAENVFAGDAAVVENQFAGGRGAEAELVFLLADLEAGEIALDEEGGDAAVSGGGIGIGEHEEEAGFGGVGDPELAAVEQEMIAALNGGGGEGEGVGAGTGFGERVRADVIAREQGKIPAFLGVVAPAEDGVVDDGVLDIDDDAGGRIDRGQFFDGEDALEEVAALAAELLGDFDAHEAEIEELLEQVRAEFRVLVHLADVRGDLVAGELAHVPAKEASSSVSWVRGGMTPDSVEAIMQRLRGGWRVRGIGGFGNRLRRGR